MYSVHVNRLYRMLVILVTILIYFSINEVINSDLKKL